MDFYQLFFCVKMYPRGGVSPQSRHCTVPRPRNQVLQTQRGPVPMQPPVVTLPVAEFIFLPTIKSSVKCRKVYVWNADLKYVRSPLLGISCLAPVRYGRKFSDCILKIILLIYCRTFSSAFTLQWGQRALKVSQSHFQCTQRGGSSSDPPYCLCTFKLFDVKIIKWIM